MREHTLLQCLLLVASFINLTQARVPAIPRIPRARILRPRDNVYSSSLRDPTTNAQFGTAGQTTTVNAGVSRWLSGLGTHNFYGNLNNYGQIIISQTDWLASHTAGGQTSDFVGHTTTDGNLNTYPGSSISLNDYGSASAPTYDWYLRTMVNYGSLQMCGRGDTGGSTYQLYCDLDCYNYGVIDMEQYYGNLGASYVWRNARLSAPGATNVVNTYNEGAFRIVNLVYHNVQNVLGNGCFVIGSNATLYLEDGSGYYQNVNFGPTFPNQKIVFTDSTGDLHMDTQVYSHNSDFGPPVYGYGAGNAIEFYQVFPTTNIFTYDTSTGILTVNFVGGNSVNINIGLGYDPSQFYNARNPSFYNTAGYNAIFYRGAAPSQSVPTVCAVSLGVCQNPAATAGVFASSSSTSATSATGYVTTTLPYSDANTITDPVTSTIAPSGTVQGTVEIFTPAPFATSTSISNGAAAASTTTVGQVGTTPGTVIVVQPASYVTVTTNSDVPAPFTTTIAQTGATPGTVLVVDPIVYVTITTASIGASAAFTSTIPPSGTTPGTVFVVQPTNTNYVTTSVPYTGTGFLDSPITTTIPPSGTAPGTVEVVTPTVTRPSTINTTIGPNTCICRPVPR